MRKLTSIKFPGLKAFQRKGPMWREETLESKFREAVRRLLESEENDGSLADVANYNFNAGQVFAYAEQLGYSVHLKREGDRWVMVEPEHEDEGDKGVKA